MIYLRLSLALVYILAAVGCGPTDNASEVHNDGHDSTEPKKGSNGGRLLSDGDFALELVIFETGVPPEFRVWITQGGEAVAPNRVDVQIVLTRLGEIRQTLSAWQSSGISRPSGKL